MSALPPKADMDLHDANVRSSPKSEPSGMERSALCHNWCIELRRSSRQCGYEGGEKCGICLT